MPLNIFTQIKKQYISLILIFVIPSMLAFVGFMFATIFENSPSSFTAMQMWGMLIVISALTYIIVGALLWSNETIPLFGTIVIVALCVFTIVTTIDSFRSLPYFEDCDQLVDVSNISMLECMSVVSVNSHYTGQQIINSVKSGEITNEIDKLEILERRLVP